MALTSCEANVIVAKSWKNPLEACRRLQKRYDLTTGGRKRNLLRESGSELAVLPQRRAAKVHLGSVATLSETCMFACDVLNGPLDHQIVRVVG